MLLVQYTLLGTREKENKLANWYDVTESQVLENSYVKMSLYDCKIKYVHEEDSNDF